MAIQTTTLKNAMIDAYKAACTHATLASTTPGSSPGTELAVTRQASNWGATSAGAATAAPAGFATTAGMNVAGLMFFNASTAGTYQDGVGVTPQSFASAGSYTITATVTQV